jgi:hypothetical protein
LILVLALFPSLTARADPPPPPVKVFLEGDPRVQLFRMDLSIDATGRRRSESAANGVLQCAAPCGVAVDPGAVYTIGGPGIVPSNAFRLPAGPEVHLKVGPPGKEKLGLAGVWLLRLAIFPVTVAALVMITLTPVVEDKLKNSFFYAAAGLAGVAVAMLAVGIPLFALNRTKVFNAGGMRIALSPTGIIF